jgi:hypothetical protein
MSDTAAASMRLADSMIGSRSHICAFFRSADEEYLNYLLPKYEDPVVCDLAKFGGDIVVDTIRTRLAKKTSSRRSIPPYQIAGTALLSV